jgi:hypothetical protein
MTATIKIWWEGEWAFEFTEPGGGQGGDLAMYSRDAGTPDLVAALERNIKSRMPPGARDVATWTRHDGGGINWAGAAASRAQAALPVTLQKRPVLAAPTVAELEEPEAEHERPRAPYDYSRWDQAAGDSTLDELLALPTTAWWASRGNFLGQIGKFGTEGWWGRMGELLDAGGDEPHERYFIHYIFWRTGAITEVQARGVRQGLQAAGLKWHVGVSTDVIRATAPTSGAKTKREGWTPDWAAGNRWNGFRMFLRYDKDHALLYMAPFGFLDAAEAWPEAPSGLSEPVMPIPWPKYLIRVRDAAQVLTRRLIDWHRGHIDLSLDPVPPVGPPSAPPRSKPRPPTGGTGGGGTRSGAAIKAELEAVKRRSRLW